MAKDAYYFSHDSNARNDVKMIKLRRMGGLESVGLYWCVVEMLREAENYKLSIDTIDDICYELRCGVDKFELLFICELLTRNETDFYSKSLNDRMKHLDSVRYKRSIAGQKGGKSKAIGKQLVSNKSKVKESKVKENIPTYDEFQAYAIQKKKNVDKAVLKLKYDAWIENDWRDGNDNQIKNWKSKLLQTLPHMKESTANQETYFY